MKPLDEMTFNEMVDEASHEVLKELLNGSLRSGVASAAHLVLQWRLANQQTVEDKKQSDKDQPMVLMLCEQNTTVLKPDVKYLFKVDINCRRCFEIAKGLGRYENQI